MFGRVSRLRRGWMVLGGVLVTGVVGIPTTAPAANFVELPTKFNDGRPYWDTASLRKTGDIAELDILYVGHSVTMPFGVQPSGSNVQLYGDLEHVRISCGLRLIETVSSTQYDRAGQPSEPSASSRSRQLEVAIPPPNSARQALMDRACAPAATTSAKGLASLQAAIQSGGETIIPPSGKALMIGPAREAPVSPAWIKGDTPPRYTPVQVATPWEAKVFVDRAGFEREGDVVTARSLTVLGAAAHRTPREAPAAVLRRVRYGCATGTIDILSQAVWDQYGQLSSQDDGPYLQRRAAESPLLAAQLAAACATDQAVPSGTQTLSSVEDAWAYARSFWPPKPKGAWSAQCLQNRFPAQETDAFIKVWAPYETAAEQAAAPAVEATAAACGVPKAETYRATALVNAWLVREAVFVALQRDHGVQRDRVMAVWAALPWADRRRLTKMMRVRDRNDNAFQARLVGMLTTDLGLSGDAEHLIAALVASNAALADEQGV